MPRWRRILYWLGLIGDEDKCVDDRPRYTKEDVRWLAHALWQEDHCPDDGEWYYWFKAERALAEEHPDPKIARLQEEARRHSRD